MRAVSRLVGTFTQMLPSSCSCVNVHTGRPQHVCCDKRCIFKHTQELCPFLRVQLLLVQIPADCNLVLLNMAGSILLVISPDTNEEELSVPKIILLAAVQAWQASRFCGAAW